MPFHTAATIYWIMPFRAAMLLGVLLAAGTSDAFAVESQAATAIESINHPRVLIERNGQLFQPMRVTVRHAGEPVDGELRAVGISSLSAAIKSGRQELEMTVPAVDRATEITLELTVAGRIAAQQKTTIAPVRKWIVYLLPHSHVDIGYTHVQTEVEAAQWKFLEMAMDAAQQSAANPPESRFKWNAEVLWAVDSYLKQAAPEKREAFVAAVRSGAIGLDALYGNELTALCRPEELLRLVSFGAALSKETGTPIESAMITDVPGYTWGIVTAFAQAGIKYFSVAPNATDRIGRTTSTWGNKPFWWIGPNGRDRVLVWLTGNGYYQVFKSTENLQAYLGQLERQGYPYDMVQVRHCLGDNGKPDIHFADLVKQWNLTHAYPKLVIATTAQMFRDFEDRYGDTLPIARGDFTPYWEDGAASSARETAINRTAAERLVQAETLWALLNPAGYPADRFAEAWRNVLLYNEHTWGAYNSVSKPDLPFVKNQWRIKQAFALDGDAQSRKLLAAAARSSKEIAASPKGIDVFNTTGWPRTDLVILPKELSTTGDAVAGPDGKPVPSQRLSTGELAFLAEEVPPLAGRRYSITAGEPTRRGQARADKTSLNNSRISVRVDPASGALESLRNTAVNAELSDTKSGVGLNRYYYVLADKVQEAQQAGPATVTIKEPGPLVASLQIVSDAPGCIRFHREIRLVDGLDRVELINVLDKKAVREKEGVHLGFAFNVPRGIMRMDIPWAVVRPELDQLTGACKNWLTVGRWVDVSNQEYGVTWATLDAPLVQVGAMTANIMGPLSKPEAWIGHLDPSQTLYSWVMNNHWYTNYRAEQEGPTMFRYALWPHQQYDPAATQRFGVECSQPLVAVPARGEAPDERPLLELDTPQVVVASLKPSTDGKAWIVRLFGAGGQAADVALRWGSRTPKRVSFSNLAEERGEAVKGSVPVPGYGLVTLRADF